MSKARKVGLGLLALLCALMLGFGLASCGSKDETPGMYGSGEEGVYYRSAAGGEEYFLTLRGGTYVLNLGSSGGLSGTYEYDEGVFAFFGNEDLSEGAFYDGVVTITYAGGSYTFLRYEYYTVTFYDGADPVYTESVLNGKAATDPGEIAKDGYVFFGWYRDPVFTATYTFDEAVTGDVSVYGRYVELTGDAEYEVTFDYGDGETCAVSTLNGRLYDLPEAEKSGYVFLGWWVSATNNADELTYRYTDETFHEETTLYAVWAEDGASYLGASVYGDRVEWMNVAGSSTTVTVYDGNGNEVLTLTVQSTGFPDIDFASLGAGKYTVEVASGGVTETLTYVANGLYRVSGFDVISGGVLVYNPVENAERYLITVECGNEGHEHTLIDNGTSLYYDFSSCEMGADGITFTVYAEADGFYTSESSYNYFLGLGSVELRADGNSVSWDRVENAMEYEVYVYGVLVAVTGGTSYSMSEYGTGIWEVTVRPVTAGYWSEQSELFLFEKMTIASPVITGVDNYVISWTDVEDAAGYIVRVGDVETFVEAGITSLYLSDENYVEGLDVYGIAVKAVAEDSANDSPYGETVYVTGSGVGTSVSYANGAVTWQYSLKASGYAVTVNDEEQNLVRGTNTSDVTLTKSGNNEIRIYFLDEEGNAYGTARVTVYAYAVIFDARGGTAYIDGEPVDVLYVAKGDVITLPDAEHDTLVADFYGWYTLPDLTDDPEADSYGGDGYRFEDGTVFTGSSTVVLYAVWLNRRIDVTLDMGVGVVYDEDGNLVSDVLVHVNSDSYVLPVPETADARYVFYGWYSKPDGQGERYSYEDGSAYRIYNDVTVTTLYAYWAEVLSFSATTYNGRDVASVSKGADINLVSSVTVPETYAIDGTELTVGVMTGGAFQNCSSLEVLNIPDTMQYMDISGNGYSVGVFQGTALTDVNVYVTGEPSTTKEVRYYSDDGVLFWINNLTGKVEILYYPYGRTDDTYVLPSYVSNENEYELQGLTEVPVVREVTSVPDSLFRDRLELVSVTIPETVTETGTYLFYGCTNLRQAIFEGEVTRIEDYTFYGCSSLLDFDIPDYVTEIGSYAFYGCVSLTGEIDIPYGVASIGSYAFSECSGIRTVVLPSTCGTVGSYAFYNCTSLRGVEMPYGLNEIGDRAFYNCSSLRAIDMPDSVTDLGERVFYGCESATRAHIPTGITAIPAYTFYQCHALRAIEIPDNITVIGDYAFYQCYSLTQITIPASVESIGTQAFRYCYKLVEIYDMSSLGITVTTGSSNGYIGSNAKNVYTPTSGESWLTDDGEGFRFLKDSSGKYYLIGYYGSETEITLPESVGDSPYEVYDYAFCGYNDLRSVTIPSSVTALGIYAFYGCKGLEDLYLDASLSDFSSSNYVFAYAGQDGDGLTLHVGAEVTGIPAYMFYPCSTAACSPNLVEVVFEEGSACESVGRYAFYNCTSLEHVNLPDSLTSLGDYSFYGCKSLSEIAVPSGVTEIGAYVFYGSEAVTELNLSDTLASIGEYAFAGCTSLTTVSIGSGLRTIASNAFSGCTSLSSVTLSSGIEYIGEDAFAGTALYTDKSYWTGDLLYIGEYLIRCDEACEGEVTVADGTTLLASAAFYGCSSVTRVALPESVTGLGDSAFYGCHALEYVNIPKGVTEIGDYLFYECYVLNGEEIPAYATSIGAYAFYNNYALTSLPLPETVSVIGKYAFYGCSSLEKINIPDAVTNIADYSFYGCSSLKVVVIPDGVTYVEQYAFYGCTSLVSIYLGEGLGTLGNRAFYNCGNVTDIYYYCTNLGNLSSQNYVFYCVGQTSTGITLYIGSNVESIPNYIFYPYTNNTYSPTITDVVFEEGSVCTSIGNYAFQGCSSMVSINLPDSLTSIGTYAFNSCFGLISITIPANVTSIGNYAFQNCYKLVEIYNESGLSITTGGTSNTVNGGLGNNALNVYTPEEGESHLVNQSGYIFVYDAENSYYLMGYNGGQADLVLPDNADGHAYSIYDYAFYERADIKSVVIPDTVTGIGTYAFRYMDALETVVIGAGITEISEYQFYQDGALKNVTFPEGLTTIGQYAFASCTSLLSSTFPASLVTIDANAFDGCSSLTSVVIPEKTETIGGYAFRNCTDITSVTMGDSVTSIGNYAFYGCSSLKSIRISESITAIPQYMLYNCESLESLTIPEGVTSIGTYAFDGCRGLKEVHYNAVSVSDLSASNYVFRYAGSYEDDTVLYIGASVTKIPAYMFSPASSSAYAAHFNEVVFEEGSVCTSIGNYAFRNDSDLRSINIPDGVTEINQYAFNGCSSLTDVRVPAALESVGQYAFQNCSSLVSLELPDTCSSIGQYAFDGCSSLAYFVIPDAVDSIANYTFRNCSALMHVTVGTNVSSIGGSYAFRYCYKLVDIYNRSSMTINGSSSMGYLGEYALNVYTTKGGSKLSEVDGYVYYRDGGTNYMVGYYGGDSDLVLPAAVDGQTYSVYDYAFYQRDDIKSVRISDGVTAVGTYAFGYSGVETVTMDSTVTSLGDYAFAYAEDLRDLTIGDGVLSIGQYAFYECYALTEVVIPDSVQTLGYCAFYSDSALVSVTIGAGVTDLGTYTFSGCTALEKVYYNAAAADDLSSNNRTFYNAGKNGSGITVYIGSGVTRVPAYLFYPYTSNATYTPYVTAVVFDQDCVCTSIGTYAFYQCSSIGYVVLSSKVASIDQYAFDGCTSLTTVYYYGNSTSFGVIAVDVYNSYFENASVYCYSASRRYGGYWHFDDDGIPTVW